MIGARTIAVAASLALGVGCAPTLAGHTTVPRDAALLAADAPLTVVVFFSATCPCQRAHDARLVALAERFSVAHVKFVVIDAEADATDQHDGEEARARGYPFAIVSDPTGHFADAFDVDTATTAIVLDPSGTVHYRGAIDSDRTRLHDDATPLLGDAIEAILAHRAPTIVASRPLGCALRRP